MAHPLYTPDAGNCMIGKGILLFDRFSAAGVQSKNFFELGNVNRLTVLPEDTRAELYSSRDAAAGLYASATTRRKVTLTAVCNEFSLKNLALVLMGDENSYTQTADPVSGEAVSSALKLGAYYKLANREVSNLVVLQGTTTLVLATDYEIVDATLGLFRILPTGAATADAAVTANYDKAAITGTDQPRISPFTQSSIIGQALFHGDPSDGPAYDARWWKASIKPTGELGLIQDEYGEFTLAFDVLSDATGAYGGSANYPYGEILSRDAA